MQSRHDPGEGSSVPRYHLGRSTAHRGRLSLVSDIENVDGDNYVHPLRPVSSVISESTVNSSILQYTPPGTASPDPSARRRHSLTSLSNTYGIQRFSLPDLDDEEDEEDEPELGPIPTQRGDTRNSDSARTESSYGAIDVDGPVIVPSLSTRHQSIPPPISIREGKRPMLTRSLSTHTASSYAMYTPRSPGKQVRFSSEKEIRPGTGNVPPLPPHALEALDLARATKTAVSPHFFHGPPPLHGDDRSPPDYFIEKAPSTDDYEGRGEKGMLGGADTDSDLQKPWWKRRKGFCFWLIMGLALLVIAFAIVVGVIVGLKVAKEKKNDAYAPEGNFTADFPPPAGFLGTWSFTTNLVEANSSCSPAPENAEDDLWRCYPYQDPPSTDPAVWNFVISGDESANQNSENVKQLMISSTKNPFALTFPPQQLNLTRYLTNAYYQFTYSYSKNTIVAINGSVAACEFPNSIITGTFYINNTIFSNQNAIFASKPRTKNDNRGEWPGEITITEEKIGGGGQILCRDRATQDVLSLGPLTDLHGRGNCLCGYKNF